MIDLRVCQCIDPIPLMSAAVIDIYSSWWYCMMSLWHHHMMNLFRVYVRRTWGASIQSTEEHEVMETASSGPSRLPTWRVFWRTKQICPGGIVQFLCGWEPTKLQVILSRSDNVSQILCRHSPCPVSLCVDCSTECEACLMEWYQSRTPYSFSLCW